MDERSRRVLESIENLILHPNTPQHEKNVGIGRWEYLTREKWTGKPKTGSSFSSSSGGNQRGKSGRAESQWGDFYKDFGADDFYRNYGGFNNFYEDLKRESQRRQQQQQSKSNWSYDFGGGCTEKQYEYIKSICEFFRWKCPQRHEIEFDEAKDFLNKYAEIFQMFTPRTRNFRNLKIIFESLGVDWNSTSRTFKWRAFGER